MPASMIMAPVGSSLKVSGRSMAMVAGGPRPGSTPMIVPSTTPITQKSRLIGVRATWNPCSRPCKTSMAFLGEEPAHGQGDVERPREEHVEADGAADRKRQRHALRLPRHDRHHEPGEEREGDHEAEEPHDRDRD